MGIKRQARPIEETYSGHPSEDRTGRHPLDAALREHGFKIYERASGKQPVWERDYILYDQLDALYQLPEREREKWLG